MASAAQLLHESRAGKFRNAFEERLSQIMYFGWDMAGHLSIGRSLYSVLSDSWGFEICESDSLKNREKLSQVFKKALCVCGLSGQNWTMTPYDGSSNVSSSVLCILCVYIHMNVCKRY